jgi:aspartyl/glutamyl-tRNA(Asn/Gln) amidotransferase C subunit
MISQEEVKHIAKLARLGLSQKETEKFQKELSAVLDYFEKMKKADVSGVEALSQPFKIENVVREDKERAKDNDNLLDSAPDSKDNYIKVKSVFK